MDVKGSSWDHQCQQRTFIFKGGNYGSICVAKLNLQCNMQNGNAIYKMAMYFCI